MDYPMAAMNILYWSVKNPYIYISHFPPLFGSSCVSVRSDASLSYFSVMMTAHIGDTVPDADIVKLCAACNAVNSKSFGSSYPLRWAYLHRQHVYSFNLSSASGVKNDYTLILMPADTLTITLRFPVQRSAPCLIKCFLLLQLKNTNDLLWLQAAPL